MSTLLRKQIYTLRRATFPQVARIKSSSRFYATAPEAPQTKDSTTAPSADTKPPLNSPLPSSESLAHEDWVLFHPVYTKEELQSVKVIHRPAENASDYLASAMVRIARRSFDLITGYVEKDVDQWLEKAKQEGKTPTVEQLRKDKVIMDEKQWMARIIFLESIAGVPGMVAGVLRHLKSLRTLKRDNGYIHTLLSEAENERYESHHTIYGSQLISPSLFMRLLILGAQGVFFNMFFLTYIFSPRGCHRFVSYLEQEAVHTYTGCIKEIEAGRLPEWEQLPAPQIAKDYWRLSKDASLLDMIYAVRADEAQHRFVNGSFANLQPNDPNPFAIKEAPASVRGARVEFTREEALAWAEEVKRQAKETAEAIEPK